MIWMTLLSSVIEREVVSGVIRAKRHNFDLTHIVLENALWRRLILYTKARVRARYVLEERMSRPCELTQRTNRFHVNVLEPF